MIYILFIWTAVSYQSNNIVVHDWRPMGEFHTTADQSAQVLCQQAARDLGLTNTKRYLCVRSK